MKLSQVFTEAAAIIEQRGWTQGTMQAHDGAVCLAQALKWATGTKDSLYVKAAMFGRDTVFGGAGTITFNDCHCKYKRDAIAALRIAADLAA